METDVGSGSAAFADRAQFGRRLRGALRSGLARNIISLYGVQFTSYIVPLVTIPYLARILGPRGWGLVAFAQSFAALVFLAIDYGFSLSATREVARFRASPEILSEVLAGVLGAKSLLVVATVAATCAIWPYIAIFRQAPALLWAGLFAGICPALSMIWYFVGRERVRLAAGVDISGKALATIAIFFIVRRPGDEWKVLMLQGVGALASMAVMVFIAYREVEFRWPSLALVLRALKMGWSMFVSRSAVSLYTIGNALILGLFAPPQIVGYYSGAEKICTAALGLLRPVQQSIFPRMSHTVESSREKAAELARVVILGIGAIGFVLGLGLFLFAPILVRIALGKGFAPAILVLRILALLPPVQALSNALGIQWMLPLGMDWYFNSITIVAGMLNLVLALALVGGFGAAGMATAVTTTEAVGLVMMVALLQAKRLHPWAMGAASVAVPTALGGR